MRDAGWAVLLAMWIASAAAGADGPIVFAHEGDIWIMDATGGERMQLTSDPADEFDPSLSPDGTRIAYRSQVEGNDEVYVMNVDGTGQANLSHAPGADYSPDWSPDGTRIAFASSRSTGGRMEVYVMSADGNGVRRVTDIPGISEYPSWSPDGTRLAFHCSFGRRLPEGVADFEICVVNADGTGLIQLTDDANESKLPAWSPDGAYIAFESNRHGWPSLPDYTPPAYDGRRAGEFDLFVMRADGTQQRNVTNNPREDDSMAAWLDDRQLVFSRYGCLMTLEVATGAAVALAPGALCSDIFPDAGH